MRVKRRQTHRRKIWARPAVILLALSALAFSVLAVPAFAIPSAGVDWWSRMFDKARALPIDGRALMPAIVAAPAGYAESMENADPAGNAAKTENAETIAKTETATKTEAADPAGYTNAPGSFPTSASGANKPPALAVTRLAPPPSPKNAEPAAQSPAPLFETESRWIALTFDDGPDDKYTPKILDILKEKDAMATFFLVGKQVEKYPEVARRIVEEGHTIGNHSWSHRNLATLKPEAYDDQVKRAQEAIADATGVEPALMRAPYGALSDEFLDYLHEQSLRHIYWTIDPRDWDGTSVAEMREGILKHAKPGGIILLHSFGGRKNALDHTLKLLPLIIDDLREAGYEFTTVDRMIEADAVAASAIK